MAAKRKKRRAKKSSSKVKKSVLARINNLERRVDSIEMPVPTMHSPSYGVPTVRYSQHVSRGPIKSIRPTLRSA